MGDDDFDPYEWHMGDPADWADGSAGVPDIPYMGYLNGDDDDYPDSPRRLSPQERSARALSDEAWKLDGEGRFEEALVLINRAIDIYPYDPDHLNSKALILRDMARYEESLEFYDKALAISRDRTIMANKAECMLALLQMKRTLNELQPDDLNFINEAIKMLPHDADTSSYLQIKGDILNHLGEPAKARICYLLASKMYDRVDEAERQLKTLHESQGTFINITGTQHYRSLEPFREGVIVDLVSEPDNPHDRNAIRVEIDGETVGYVANSKHTLINEVKSATDIKDLHPKRAKVLFILFRDYVIAKLV